MCMFCGYGFVSHIIREEQGEDWSPGVSAYVMGDALHVDIDGDSFWEFKAPINYCPMCGRYLRGDAS